MADLGTHAAPSLNLSLTCEGDGGDFQGSLCAGELGGEVYGRPRLPAGWGATCSQGPPGKH